MYLKVAMVVSLFACCGSAHAFDSPRDWQRHDGRTPSTTKLRKAMKQCEIADAARRSKMYPNVFVDLNAIRSCMDRYGYKLKSD